MFSTNRKNIMKLYTTIEVDEIDTEVVVDFEQTAPGELEIISVTDEDGSAVELTSLQTMVILEACHEKLAEVAYEKYDY